MDKSKSHPVFIREATGLVRSLSTFNSVSISLGQITPMTAMVFVLSASFAVFPQGNLLYAVLLDILLLLPVAVMYSMLAAAMPRTGGDYVYVSRVLHPSLGFMASWLFTIIIIYFIGSIGLLFTSTALNVFVSTIGMLIGSQYLIESSTWFTTSIGILIVGSLLNLIIVVLMIFGRAVYTFLKIILVVVMIGTVLNIAFLALLPTSSFIATWNGLTTDPALSYTGVVQTAAQYGFTPGWNWSGTVAALPYATFAMIGFQFCVYSAGEAKNATKSIPISVISSMVLAAVVFAIWMAAAFRAFGFDFFSSASYLANCGCAPEVAFPVPVSVNSLFTIIPQNPVLVIIEAFCFVGAWIWAAPTNFIVFTRNTFAWSFDRVAPAWLADVNDRYHTPVKGIVVSFLLGELALVAFVYTSAMVMISNSVLLTHIVFLLVAISAIVFPYKAKRAFELSPGWVRSRILGVPSVTIVGVLATIVEVYLLYSSFSNPAIGGSPSSYPFAIGFAVSALVIFFLVREYRKRQGIDLSLAFNQIPPE
jgi:amino acid transporter